MSDLIAVAFNDEFKAEQVRLDLLKIRHKHLVELEEAAVVALLLCERKMDFGGITPMEL
jgi:uncharacterized membrane protein